MISWEIQTSGYGGHATGIAETKDEDPSARPWTLRRAFDRLIEDLRFNARIEAPLPEGFPGPGPVGPESLERLVAAGRVDVAYALLSRLGGDPREADVARARGLLAHMSLAKLKPVAARIAALGDEAIKRERWAHYQALFAYDDAAQVDQLTRRRLARAAATAPEWLAAGRLAYERLDYSRAESCFTAALSLPGPGGGPEALCLVF